MAGKRTNARKDRSVLKVVELFAGVGGFRIGLQAANKRAKGPQFEVVWSNQWEPGKKQQMASRIYEARFGPAGHTCQDVATVPADDIPDHDLLVGGFPCQDYSVASTLKASKGLQGKKGVLWWEIHRILREKAARPSYLLLENVDRLLVSPAGQRGRDMAIMLRSLSDLGYAVEWRVVNAAEYGMPQRRRRVFILGVHRTSPLFAAYRGAKAGTFEHLLLQRAFPVHNKAEDKRPFVLEGTAAQLSNEFNGDGGKSPFANCGWMVNGKVHTRKVEARYAGKRITLGDIVARTSHVPPEFFLSRAELPKWRALKGAKREQRVSAATGHRYLYSEGKMAFPDPLDKPARTIVTGEGGAGASRFKHVIASPDGRYRRLVPEELERINMFPAGHTSGAVAAQRAFFMGNALVTGVVERIGRVLSDALANA